jgi:hypothetical protein
MGSAGSETCRRKQQADPLRPRSSDDVRAQGAAATSAASCNKVKQAQAAIANWIHIYKSSRYAPPAVELLEELSREMVPNRP